MDKIRFKLGLIIFLCMSWAFLPITGAEKVLIFTYSYNRPDFIELQYKTFKKFLKDDYKFVVFNDASKPDMKKKIRKTCKRLKITCIDIPQSIHLLPYLYRWPEEDFNHPSVRNSNVVQFSLDHYGFKHKGIVALFDSDLFLVRELSITEMMEGYGLTGLPQSKTNANGEVVNYLWIGLAFLDMGRIPNKETINFNCGRINDVGVDAGGHTYYYLVNNPEVPVRYINESSWPFSRCAACNENKTLNCLHNETGLQAWGFDNKQIEFIHTGPENSQFLDNAYFFHYRGGTNWDNRPPEYHRLKTEKLYEYIDNIISN